MDAVHLMLPGSTLMACASEVRCGTKSGAGQRTCSGIAGRTGRRSIPARPKVCALGGEGAESRNYGWESLPTGTHQLLQHLGNDNPGLSAESVLDRAGGSTPRQVDNGVEQGYVSLFVRLLGVDNSLEDREAAVQALRRHASRGVENVDEILAFPGCLNLVVSLLPSERPESAEAAARLLRHVSELNAYRSLVAECGALEEIAGLLTRRAVPDEVREQALFVLWNVSVEEKWRSKITQLELVPVLVALLHAEDDVLKEAAAGVLSNLALSYENHDALAKAGCVEKFATLLQKDLNETTKVIRQEARNLLLELSRTGEFRTAIIEQGLVPVPLVGASAYKSFKPLLDVTPAVPQNVTVEQSAELDTVFGAGKLLLGLKLGQDAHAIDEATRSAREGIVRQQFLARIGVLEKEKSGKEERQATTDDRSFTFMPWWDALPRLILILGLEDTAVSQRAAESISEIATNEENRIALHKAGAVPHLVRMLGCGDESATEAAVVALGNLAISHKLRKSIAAHGAVDALVAILKAGSSCCSLNKAVAALAQLSQTGESESGSLVTAGRVPGLAEIANSQSTTVEVKEEIEEILEEMSARKGDVRSDIIAAGGVPLLVDGLSSGTAFQADKAACVLENLAVAESNALVVVRSGIEGALTAVLEVYLDSGVARGCLSTCEDVWIVVGAACRLLSRLLVHDSVRNMLNLSEFKTILDKILKSECPMDIRDLVGVCLHRLDGQQLFETNFGRQVGGSDTIPRLIEDIAAAVAPGRQEAAVVTVRRLLFGGDYSIVAAFVGGGGIPVLVKLLEMGSPLAKEAALEILQQLGKNEENRSSIVAAGAVPILARIGRLGLPGWKHAAELLRVLPSMYK